MPGTFTYTKSTNTLVVTDGTSGSPADFASMLTADRAGSVTLLAAWTPNSNTKALTYQITPAEVLALLISFVVASKTTQTDYIFITGTDAWGNAQTESINVSVGNGTYVSTKRFRTITNIDCSDNAAGGGTVWADGTVAVTQPQWGVISKGTLDQYQISCLIEIGDGSTSTYFASTSCQQVIFAENCYPKALSEATVRLGEKYGSYGYNGVSWNLNLTGFGTTYWASVDSGIWLIYDSSIYDAGAVDHTFRWGGTTTLIGAKLKGSGVWANVAFTFSTTSFTDVYITSCQGLRLTVSPSVFTNVFIHFCLTSIYAQYNPVTANAPRITESIAFDIQTWNALDPGLILIDPVNVPMTFNLIGGGASYVKYSVNFKVIDKFSDPIENAIVSCYDNNDDLVFSVLTCAVGKIVEELVTYRKIYTDAPLFANYYPFKLTVTKLGYQDLVMENINIYYPINWTVELQPAGTANMSRVRVGH